MGTPGDPEHGRPDPLVYGAGCRAINRRAALAGGLAAVALPLPVRAAPTLLERAEAATGGRALLSRVTALSWTGAARVCADGRALDLRVETRVEPFGPARSRSWPALQGEANARTLRVGADGGWVERGETRAPLPPAQAEHERQQFGLYGYMLLALAQVTEVGGALLAERPGYPPATLFAGPDGRLAAAEYPVAAPDGRGITAQRVILSGAVGDAGLTWPARVAVARAGRPYYDLVIERLRVETLA